MGAASSDARAQESLKLLNWGFQNFDAVRLYEANQAIATPRLWKGTEKEIKLGFQHPIYMTLPKGQAGNIKSTLDRKDPLVAPIAAGERIGTLKLTLDGKPIARPAGRVARHRPAGRLLRPRVGRGPPDGEVTARRSTAPERLR